MIIIKIYLSSRIKIDFLKKSQKKLEVLEMKNKKIYCKTFNKITPNSSATIQKKNPLYDKVLVLSNMSLWMIYNQNRIKKFYF